MSRNLRVLSEYRSDPAAGAVAPNPRKPKPHVEPSARKQPGRRYGPAPKAAPHAGMQAPKPMGGARRYDLSTNCGRRNLTAKQMRQLHRMAGQPSDPRPMPRINGKGAETTKQKKVRR